MKLVLLENQPSFPHEIHPFIMNARLFDSSSSSDFKVYYSDKDLGYFIKVGGKGSLSREARMTEYMHSLGLSAQVMRYFSTTERDYLVTKKVLGSDCTSADYLKDPRRLCDIIAINLRKLHAINPPTALVLNHTDEYLKVAKNNYLSGHYNKSHFPDSFGFRSAEAAYSILQNYGSLLRADTLIHGDYGLPNIVLNNWEFSGFIDVGDGGLGDRHIDIFWALWSLEFNLKSDSYREQFIDTYGREMVDENMLKIVAAAEVFN